MDLGLMAFVILKKGPGQGKPACLSVARQRRRSVRCEACPFIEMRWWNGSSDPVHGGQVPRSGRVQMEN